VSPVPSRVAHSVLAVDLHGKPDFHSHCPDHIGNGYKCKACGQEGKKSVTHRGQQLTFAGDRFDVWRCPEMGGHLFTSKPMKDIPSVDELPAWLKANQYTAVGIDARKAGA
jgi:hypothetical protein